MAAPSRAGALPVSLTDPAGRITFANPAFARATGYAPARLPGMTYRRLRHGGTPPEVLADMGRTLRSGRPWSAPLRLRTRDGDARWVRANVAPVLDDGAVVGYLAILAEPSPAEIVHAQAIEGALARGGARGYRFEAGRWVRTDPASTLARRLGGSLGIRHVAATGGMAATSVALLWAAVPPGPVLWLATSLQLGVAGALCAAFVRRVVAPLRALEATAHRLAMGDVDARVGVDRDDEVGRAARALEQLALTFAAVVGDVRDAGGPGDGWEGGERVGDERNAHERAARTPTTDTRHRALASDAVAHEIAAITAIALRTHALALQVAIEATRDGDAGRELSRLAGEARRLARCGIEAARQAASPDEAGRSALALARLEARAARLFRSLDALQPPTGT